MAKKREFRFGWCATEHHGRCRGALRRPRTDETEPVVLCTCPCHIGQDVAPPEELAPRVDGNKARKSWLEQCWSDIVVYQDVEIECDEDEYKSVAASLRRMADGAEFVIKTRYSDGKLRVRVL